MDPTITIRRQKVSCHIGVPDEERAAPQTLEISVSFPLPDFDEAARNDDIASSIDYQKVYDTIHVIASQRPRKLIETLAHDLQTGLKGKFQLEWVDIEIRKFILPDTEAVVLKFAGSADVPPAEESHK